MCSFFSYEKISGANFNIVISKNEIEKYVRHFWYVNYGLGDCDTEGEVVKNQNAKSEFKDAYFVCKEKTWKFASVIEYDTFKKDCSKDGSIVEGDVDASNKYVCDDGSFREANIQESGLGKGCVSYNRGKTEILDNGFVYTCTADGWTFDKSNVSLKDSRDGEVYRIVAIGEQIWMAENLRYDAPNSVCEDDCSENGRFYMWSVAMDSVGEFSENGKGCGYVDFVATCSAKPPVRGICPEGWHLPTTAEFRTLIASIGGDGKNPEVLQSKGFEKWPDATDEFGFSAVPIRGAGLAIITGISVSTDREYEGRHESLGINSTGIFVYADDSYNYQSIRCIMDAP